MEKKEFLSMEQQYDERVIEIARVAKVVKRWSSIPIPCRGCCW